MRIILNIIIGIVAIASFVFSVIILLYFGMLFYFAYQDDTTYKYQQFQCQNKSFTNAVPVGLYGSVYSKILTLKMDADTTALKIYPSGSKFKFLSLYSIYDFEGGTFYDYLIEDEQGVKIFIDFGDIDPKKCTFDTFNQYWFRNNKEYRPTKNKTKINKSERDELFDSSIAPYSHANDEKYLGNIEKLNTDVDKNHTLTLKIPNQDFYHFAKKIVEQNLPILRKENLHLKIEKNAAGVFVPTFYLSGYSFSQFTCEDLDVSDIYSCYKHFPAWLHSPYKTSVYLPPKDASELSARLVGLNRNSHLLVAYIDKLDMAKYLQMIYNYQKILERRKENNFTKTHIKNTRIYNSTMKNFILITGNHDRKYPLRSTGVNILNHNGKLEKVIFSLSYHPEEIDKYIQKTHVGQ